MPVWFWWEDTVPPGPDDVAEKSRIEDTVEVREAVGGDGRVRVEGIVGDVVDGTADVEEGVA